VQRLISYSAVIKKKYLLICRLNSKSAYYKASIKHKYNTKTAQIHKETLNK
jgi:hypothetical protein